MNFSFDSGDQTSGIHYEKKQGYYMYFLVKMIRDAKGDLPMKELFERASIIVKHVAALTDKIQEL